MKENLKNVDLQINEAPSNNSLVTVEEDWSKYLSPIDEVVEDIRNGKMVVLVDDEDRENEGDLIIAAQMATPDAINFMSKYGRGLVCLSLDHKRIEQLNLPLMEQNNRRTNRTAFTLSIEAKEGVTTGISAADRARTIAVAIDPQKSRDDLNVPGHIFPLAAKQGGVLERAGHTEAAVDLAAMAGLIPAGVICEIMNEDGQMARLPDLVKFSQNHQLKIATIADLIAYRLSHETTVTRTHTSELVTEHAGKFKLHIYQNQLSGHEHIALIKGNIEDSDSVLVRMHAMNIFNDVLLSTQSSRAGELHKAMQLIDQNGSGVVVIIRDRSQDSVSKHISDAMNFGGGKKSVELRNYGIGAQILRDLGVQKMELLTNSQRKIVSLEGYDLEITSTRGIK